MSFARDAVFSVLILRRVRGKKEILAAAYRIFAAQGYDEGPSSPRRECAELAGVAGHITLRDPKGRGFWFVLRHPAELTSQGHRVRHGLRRASESSATR